MSVVVETLLPGVRQIRLDRPERMNALGVDTVDALLAALAEVGDARVVLLRGTGRAFCAGADLKQRAGMDLAARIAHNRGINAVADALEALPMPTIAVLNGVALGGGLELALACDLRFCAASARVGLTETRVGAIPGAGGTQRLPRLIGTARALKMMLAGEPVDAATAAAWDVVEEVVADDALDARVLAYAGVLASRSPRGLRLLKQVVRAGMAQDLAGGLRVEREALAAVFGSADYAEGLAAFAERRAPVFAEEETVR